MIMLLQNVNHTFKKNKTTYLLTQTNSTTKNGTLVKCIFPFEWNLQFVCRYFSLQSAKLIIVTRFIRRKKKQISENRKDKMSKSKLFFLFGIQFKEKYFSVCMVLYTLIAFCQHLIVRNHEFVIYFKCLFEWGFESYFFPFRFDRNFD